MKRITSLAVSFGLFAALAGAQTPPVPPTPPVAPTPPTLRAAPHVQLPDIELKLDQFRPAFRSLDQLKDLDLTAMAFDKRLADVDGLIADFQASFDDQQGRILVARGSQGAPVFAASSDYDRGTSLLDSGRYDRAVEAFDKVIAANGPKAEGAMYWKAYALNRLGKRTEALTVIDELVKKFPSGRWTNDAKALRIDVQRASGQPVQPDQTSDEDLKLIALNGVISSNPDQGIPMVEQILNSSASPRLKQRALFVLAQSASPRAKALLTEFARGSKGNPDMQLKALDYLGAFKGGPDVKLLLEVYKSTNDVDVKRRVIRSLGSSSRRGLFVITDGNNLFSSLQFSANGYDKAMESARAALAQAEANLSKSLAQDQRDKIRIEIDKARVQLKEEGATTAEREKAREERAKAAGEALWSLYQAETSVDLKREILRNLRFTTQSDHLLQIAKTETNPLLRQSAVQGLIFDKTPQSAETMLGLYKIEKDPAVRRQIADSVASTHGNAATLVQMARMETDPALRKRLVERLSTMKDKEAVDYMMEILKK